MPARSTLLDQMKEGGEGAEGIREKGIGSRMEKVGTEDANTWTKLVMYM